MSVDISVVMATRNRAELLPPTLGALHGIDSRLAWEVVYVDNGSTDGTRAVLERFARTASMPVSILHESRRGAGRARNLGWRHARGAIIAFTDDDCYPAPDWLDRMASCFGRSEVGYVGGRILLHDPTDFPITISERTDRFDLPPWRFVAPGLLQGANWAVRRTLLEQVGGFDPELGPGTPWVCEELELQARLSAAGWTGTYDPGPLVYHHHRRKTRKEVDALRKVYYRGCGAYRAKCAMDPAMRREWLRHWYWAIRSQPLSVTAHELQGAATYVFRRRHAKS